MTYTPLHLHGGGFLVSEETRSESSIREKHNEMHFFRDDANRNLG